MSVDGADPASWDAAINEAAVLLLAGPGDDAQRLRALCGRLAALRAAGAPPVWVQDALGRAIATGEAGLGGSLSMADALQRVATELELLMEGPESAAGSEPEAAVEVAPGPPARRATSRPALDGAAARELFPEFLQESLDYLEQAEAALLELEADGTAAESINVVFRAFHTIKSSAAFLGLDALSTLAHDAESLLAPVRDRQAPFDRLHADLMLGAADVMRELLGRAEAGTGVVHGELPPGYAPLRQRMADALRGAGRPAAAGGASDDALRTAAPRGPGDVPGTVDSRFAAAAAHAASTADGWARVRTLRLDQLLDLMGELVVAQSMVEQDPLVVEERHGALGRHVRRTSKIVRELQGLGIGLRMVPLRSLFQRMHRLVRDLAAQSGKEVELVTSGEETEIDRTMVEGLTDPLVHMIRNAVDHAFESPAQRAAAGKPAAGKLRLTAHHAGGGVVVELEDDGRGLDRERILQSARKRGLVPSGQELSGAEADALIFAPGLSTASGVTELSGRGVGMDVVRRHVESLRGSIEIVSRPGAGTKFTLQLPLTLAITDGMVVRAAGERYILPTFSMVTSFRPDPGALTRAAHGGELVMLHGRPLPVVRLHHVFGIPEAIADPAAGVLVVLEEGQDRYALLVDELLGQQQFVAKPLAAGLGTVPGVAGSAVLGDGCVGLILDPASLVAAARRLPAWA